MKTDFKFSRYQAILILSAPNLYYVTHFDNEDAAVIIAPDERLYLTDARYTEDAEQKCKMYDFNVIDIGRQRLIECVCNEINRLQVSVVGAELDAMLVSAFNKIKELCPTVEFVDVSGEFSEMRAIKSEDELNIMREAQKIADFSYKKVFERIGEGISERELAAELEFLLKSNGADGLSFPSIVAFGENTSKPHARPSDRRLKKRDFITLDFGVKYNGYCSDMTRTLCYYAVTEEMSDCYYLVLEAQLKAIAKAKAGMKACDLDAVARNFFKESNVSERFVHSLGHSLGIEIHESVRISAASTDILKENMVYSIEPGLYFPGKFGVRIEDVVIQRENSVENLTNSEKQLIILK